MAAGPADVKVVLVLDGDKGHPWPRLFAGKRLANGSSLRIVQASWMNVITVSYATGCMVTVAPLNDTDGVENELGGTRNQVTVKPDFLIVRNQARGPTPPSDMRDQLFALMHAGVPAISSLESTYMCLERPIMMGKLYSIARREGHANFPVIKQTFYSKPSTMVICDYPAVLKVSHAHAGMGKILVSDSYVFR